MYALIAVGAITFLMSFSGSYEPMLTAMYVYSGIAIVLALLAAVYTAAVKPENIKKSGIGIGAMIVVLIISYAMADGSVPEKYVDTVSSSASKWSGAGLYAFYILFFVAIASIVVTGVMNMIKK